MEEKKVKLICKTDEVSGVFMNEKPFIFKKYRRGEPFEVTENEAKIMLTRERFKRVIK